MKLIPHDDRMVPADDVLIELDRLRYEESLYEFLKGAWKQFEPAPFVDGWVLEAICEHLEAVCDGEIKRLLINVPPRTGKSSLISIAFPAWVWAQRNRSHTSGPNVRFVSASFGFRLAGRLSRRSRELIRGAWYQKLWGQRFTLTRDQETNVENSEGGARIVMSVDTPPTGDGGDIILIDDPNKAKEETEADIFAVTDWWDTAMPTRLNNLKEGAYVLVQQRTGENDLTGHIQERENGNWCQLILPMHHEIPSRTFSFIGWKDPRTEVGELLWEGRFGGAEVADLEQRLGPYASAGQLEQRPEPKGGGIIKRDWWETWVRDTFPAFDYILASLDTAYTEKAQNDPSAMTIWGVFSGAELGSSGINIKSGERFERVAVDDRIAAEDAPRVMLIHAWSERLELHDLVQKVAKVCGRSNDGYKVDKLVIENKATGISVAQELRRLFRNEEFVVQTLDPKSQDKMSRLYSVQHLFAEGMVYAPDRSWADMTISQCAAFPKAKHDDLVDTVSQALRHLRELGLLTRAVERRAEIEEDLRHKGADPGSLYPG